MATSTFRHLWDSLWTNITQLYTSGHDNTAELRRHMIHILCNGLSIAAMFIFILSYALIDWRKLWAPALLSLGCVPFYILAIWLNRRGWFLASKICFFLTITGSILVSTWFLVGRGPGLHFFLLLVSVLPLLLWSLRQIGLIILFMGLALAAFVQVQFRLNEPAQVAGAFPHFWQDVFGMASVITAYGLTLLILVVFQRRAEANSKDLAHKAHTMEDLMHKCEELSSTDPLTRLLNRRAMTMRMDEANLRLNRTRTGFSLLVCDIDQFKLVNDHYGHEAGDGVLVAVACLLQSAVRKVDHVASWGGEEFLILLSDTPLEGARVVGEKIRSRMEATVIP